jgi:hypothetical protein
MISALFLLLFLLSLCWVFSSPLDLSVLSRFSSLFSQPSLPPPTPRSVCKYYLIGKEDACNLRRSLG